MTVSIEPLSCGSLSAGLDFFEEGASGERVRLPVPAWLIRHPKGTVVFDTGMHPDLIGPSVRTDVATLFFEIDYADADTVASRLGACGVDAADVDIAVLSHLHFDHAGGLMMLQNARVVVQQAEWEIGLDPDEAQAAGFYPEDYLLGHDLDLADGEHDLFGDGLVTCIPTPGHTPGHQSLRVRLADREVVLCGDCCYFDRTIEGGAMPPISSNVEQQMASRDRLRAMRAAGALVIPGHDAAVLDALPPRLV